MSDPQAASARAAPPQRTGIPEAWVGLAIAVGTAALAARLWLFVDAHAVNLMVMDQFDFFAPLFEEGYGPLEKFRFQFWKSPHRMGAGWPLIEGVARLSRWDTRADSFSIAIVLIVSAVLALVLVRRLAGRLQPWDLCVPLLVLSLKQHATFVGTPDVALGAMPVLLLVATGLALTTRRPSLRIALLVVLDLLCVYTGFALFAGLLIPLLIAYEALAKHAQPVLVWGAVALCAAIGASFFVGYDVTPATRPVATDLAPLDYVGYASNLFASFFQTRSVAAATLVALLWPLALGLPLVLAGARMLGRRAAPVDTVVFLLAGFGWLFVVFNTAGRVGESADYAFASRYITLMVPGFLGVYLAARTATGVGVRRAGLGVLALALVVSEVGGTRASRAGVALAADTKRAWKRCYLESRDFELCNARVGPIVYPKPAEFARIRLRLAQLEERRLNLFKDAKP